MNYIEVRIPIDMRYIKTKDKLRELMNDSKILNLLERKSLHATFFHSDIYDLNDITKYFVIDPIKIFGRVEYIDYDAEEIIIYINDRSPYINITDGISGLYKSMIAYPRLYMKEGELKLITFDIVIKTNTIQYRIKNERGFYYEAI